MKPCQTAHAEEFLNQYIDGELSSSDESRLFAHLSTCTACREQFNSLFVFRLAARQETIEVPPAADEAVLARIDQLRRAGQPAPDRSTETRSPVRLYDRRFAFASAAAVALFVAVFGWSVHTATLVEPEEPVFQLTETVIQDGALYVISPGVTVEETKLAQ